MRTTTLALSAVALLAAAAPASASASEYTVTGGKLDWTLANAFTNFQDANRTWLGYVTYSQAGPGSSNGSAAVTAPATLTGPTGAPAASVTPGSVRGVDQLYTFGYPVTSGGAYDDKGVGSVETTGTVTFLIHGFPITVVDPLVTLNGLTGTLSASGVTAGPSGPTGTYDRSKPQFNLDLSSAEVKLRADGSRRITGIVPVATADTALVDFPANRFGTMSLTLALDDAPAPQLGATGRDGANGTNGTNGVNGKDGRNATLRVVRLKKAPFKTAAEVHVRLVDRTTRKTIARGTAERTTLRLGVLTGTKLRGTYLLERTAKHASGSLRATIKIG